MTTIQAGDKKGSSKSTKSSSTSTKKSSSKKSSTKKSAQAKDKNQPQLKVVDSGFIDNVVAGGVQVGHYAEVVSGEHEGRYGVVHSVTDTDKDGGPKSVVFVTRDQDHARLVVDYSDLKAALPGRR